MHIWCDLFFAFWSGFIYFH